MHLEHLTGRFVAFLPTLALLLLLAVAGYFAARLLSRAASWAVKNFGIEAFAEKMGVSKLLYAAGLRAGVGRIAAGVVFWTVILVVCTLGAEVAGLTIIADGITRLIAFLPRVVIGLVILVLGLRAADAVRSIVLSAAQERLAAPKAIASGTYYALVVCTIAFAAKQSGFETTLLDGLIQVVVAATCFGIALALALASKATLSQLIARQYVSSIFKPGDTIGLPDQPGVEGVIVRFVGPSVVLSANDVMLVVPCKQLLESVVQQRMALPDASEDTPAPESTAPEDTAPEDTAPEDTPAAP